MTAPAADTRFELDIFTDEDWARLGSSQGAQRFLINAADALGYYGTPYAERHNRDSAPIMHDAYETVRLRLCSLVTHQVMPEERDLDVHDDLRAEITLCVEAGLKWGYRAANCLLEETGVKGDG